MEKHPSRLTLVQRIAVVKIYYECGKCYRDTSKLLSKQFDRPKVCHKAIKAVIDNFNKTGSVQDAKRSGRPVTATTDEKAKEMFSSLVRSPQKSTRRMSLELKISFKSVYNLMKKKI